MWARSEHRARWEGMMQRCYYAKAVSYKNYGARGIKVCKEWHNFKTFQTWAIETYQNDKQLDRIDNDKDYSPANCGWSSRSEQMRNRRTTKLFLVAVRQNIKNAILIAAKDKHKIFGDPKTRKTKRCFYCKKFRPISLFHNSRSTVDGLTYLCKPCSKLRNIKIQKQTKAKRL